MFTISRTIHTLVLVAFIVGQVLFLPFYTYANQHTVNSGDLTGAATSVVTSCAGAAIGALIGSTANKINSVAVNDGPTERSTGGDNIKNCLLDGIAVAMREVLIKKITGSIVEWINGGFDGAPAFVQNPEEFFTDIADETFGNFIANDENFSFLCSPFQPKIKLALALGYAGQTSGDQASCSLTGIVDNVQNAAENLSVDFDWDTFSTIGTTPGGNIISSYIDAEQRAAAAISAKLELGNQEINLGNGFLSFKTCQDDKPGGYVSTVASGGVNGKAVQSAREKKWFSQNGQYCQIATPGSVINEQLNNTLDSELRRIELADEFDEVFSALVGYLIQQVLGPGGLFGTTQRSGNARSFISEYTNGEAPPEVIARTRNDLILLLGNYKDGAQAYLQAKNNTFQELLEIKSSLESVRLCYDSKYNTWIRNSNGDVINPEQINTVSSSERTRATFYKDITIGTGDEERETRVFLNPSTSRDRMNEYEDYTSDLDSRMNRVLADIEDTEFYLLLAQSYEADISGYDNDQDFFEGSLTNSEILGELEDENGVDITGQGNFVSATVSLEDILTAYSKITQELDEFDTNQAAAEAQEVQVLKAEYADGTITGSSPASALATCQSYAHIQNVN